MAINLIATTEGALQFLLSAIAWQQSLGGDWTCHLFANNYTITDATLLSNLTEASFSGYSAQVPTWATAVIVSGVPTRAGSTVTWTYTGGSTTTIYGIYVTDAAFTAMVGAANFAAPVVLTVAQPSYSAQVNITNITQY